jgi:WD40 repeat protein
MIVGLLLIACARNERDQDFLATAVAIVEETPAIIVNSPTPLLAASLTPTITLAPTASSVPLPPATPAVEPTPTPIPTASPTSPLWVRVGTPLPPVNEIINADTVVQVMELGRWGRGVINALAPSGDGRWVAVAAASGVYIHNVDDLNAPPRVIETAGNVTAVALSAAGDTVAFALLQGELQVWQIEPAKLVFAQSSTRKIREIQFSPGDAVLAIVRRLPDSARARVELLDSKEGTMVAFYSTWLDPRFSFSPDGSRIAVWKNNYDVDVTVYDWRNGEIVFSREAAIHPPDSGDDYQPFIGDVTFATEDDLYFLVHEVRDYTFPTGRIEVQLARRAEEAQLLFSGDSTGRLSIITKYVCNEPVFFWNAPEPTLPYQMEISVDGEIAAIFWVGYGGNNDRRSILRFYQVASGKLLYTIEEKVVDFALLPDGQTWLAGLQDGRLQRRKLSDGAVLESVDGYESPLLNLEVSSDNQWIGVAYLDRVKIYSLADNNTRYHYGALEVTFAPDSSSFALGYPDGRIEIRQMSNGELLTAVAAHEDLVTALHYLPSGELLSAGYDCNLTVWQTPDITLLSSLENIMVIGEYFGEEVPWRVRRFLIMLDGETVIGLLFGREFGLWSLRDGRLLHGPDWEKYTDIQAISMDGAYLAASMSVSARLWDGAPQPLRASGNVASFSPDSKLLVSNLSGYRQDPNLYGVLQVWAVPEMTWLYNLMPQTLDVTAIAFADDGRLLISGALDGVIRVWAIPESASGP